MLNLISFEMLRLLRSEREREFEQDRLAALIRADRARCRRPGGLGARLARTRRPRTAPCAC